MTKHPWTTGFLARRLLCLLEVLYAISTMPPAEMRKDIGDNLSRECSQIDTRELHNSLIFNEVIASDDIKSVFPVLDIQIHDLRGCPRSLCEHLILLISGPLAGLAWASPIAYRGC